MNKLLLCTIIFLSLKGFSQPVSKFRIDPDKAYGGTVSEYFDSVEYIPLETTKASLFGDVWEMEVTDSSYVISDNDTRSVYLFTLNGKFIKKINDQPFFFYDAGKKLIIVSKYLPGGTKERVSYLNLHGARTQPDIQFDLKDISLQLKNSPSLESDYVITMNRDIVSDEKLTPNKTYYAYSVYKGSSLYKQILPIDSAVLPITKKLIFLSLLTNIENGIFIASTPFNFKLYKVSKDTAVQMCQLVFPASRVWPKQIVESADEKLLDSLNQATTLTHNFIMNLRNLFFDKSRLFFTLSTPSFVSSFNNSLNEYQYNFYYDTLSGRTVCLDRIVPDSTSSFLPVMGENSKSTGLIFSHNTCYSYLSSLTLFTAKEATVDKHPVYPPALQKYFSIQTRKSNPVIVKMKLKE